MSINDLHNATEKESFLADVYQKLAEAEGQLSDESSLIDCEVGFENLRKKQSCD